MLTIGSLFSGIGGLELGLLWAGIGPVLWQVEKDPFCRQDLAKQWPEVPTYDDVTTVGAAELQPVDLICGGFPCQDISSAGKGEGLTGSRSGLWFEFARIIEELQPEWVVIENVAGGATKWVDPVCGWLAKRGYGTLPVPLSASDVGAPHPRSRVFIIAHADGVEIRQQSRWGRGASRSDPSEHPSASNAGPATGTSSWISRPEICGVSNGIPNRMDRNRALGNAVVPQCAEVIGLMILELIVAQEGKI